jgi:hypothetical protein
MSSPGKFICLILLGVSIILEQKTEAQITRVIMTYCIYECVDIAYAYLKVRTWRKRKKSPASAENRTIVFSFIIRLFNHAFQLSTTCYKMSSGRVTCEW